MVIHNTPAKALQYEASLIARLSDPAINSTLAFWTTDQCLVAPVSLTKRIGYAQACTRLRKIGWPVVVRKTGGGVTPQGRGILNVALAYALDPIESPTINGVYQMFCSPLIKLLAQSGCNAHTGCVKDCFCDGAYNVVVDGKKVIGTAQRWTRVKSPESRQVVFAHALILIDADLTACIDAVNQLYLTCGIEKCAKVSAHANLKALAHARGQTVEQIGIAEILSRLYRDELVDLSE